MPELSAGLPGLPDLPWESLSHRQVLAGLATEGWVPCGVATGRWRCGPRREPLSRGYVRFVAPVDHPVAGQFAGQWRARADDPQFQEVHRAARMIDADYRKSTPWWGRCDLDDAHIFRAAG